MDEITQTKQEIDKPVDAPNIIAYAGWAKSMPLPASRSIYYANDTNGNIAKALKSLGFRESNSLDGYCYKRDCADDYVAGMAVLLNEPTIIISAKSKETLDKICGMDIASPSSHHVAEPEITKHEPSREVA